MAKEVIRTSFDDLLSPEPKSSASGGAFEFPDYGEKSKWKERNDRQLRLWGIHGQDLIDKARVCLLNATAVGAETLKNIVLPGFGHYTIVDNKKVEPRDLGINFYLTIDCVGKSRALAVCQHIAELNEENVTGEYYEKDPAEVINKEPDFFDKFDFIIASQLHTKDVMKLCAICEQKNKVLVVVRSFGLIGYVRIYTRTHEILDTKPEQPIVDLRLADSWPELLKFCALQDLSKMNLVEYIHTPFPVILLNTMLEWKKQNGDKLPSNSSEKQSYVELIKKYASVDKRTKEEIEEDKSHGRFAPEKENFLEAVKNAYLAYQKTEIPERVQQVLNDPTLNNLTKDTSNFWFMAYGLKKFVENEGKGTLPLQGRLPDLESDTTRYTKMQGIYRRKAKEDRKIIEAYVKKALKEAGKAENSISEEDLKDFCSNSFYLGVVHYRTLQQELDSKTVHKDDIHEGLGENPTSSPVIFYLGLLALDDYFEKYGKYPGENLDDDYIKEAGDLQPLFESVLKKFEIDEPQFNVSDYCKELSRYGACELHNVSSLVGGVAAQELIKLCTKQRIPIQNTWVYNGINSTTLSFQA